MRSFSREYRYAAGLEFFLLQAGGPSVDLNQLALTGQSVQVPADGGLGGSSGLTQLGHADGLVLGKLL